MFDPDRLPPPDDMGFFYHPDIPDTDDEEPITPALEAMGYEAAFQSFYANAPEDLKDAWMNDDNTAPARWTPQPPDGEGWLLAAKYDTEDGPYAIFVRPLLPL